MGQQEVYNFLKKHRGIKYSVKEMSKHLKVSPGAITSNCNRLLIQNFIKVEQHQKKHYTINKYWI